MSKIIPGTENIVIKPEFEERYKKLCSKNYDEFLRYSLTFVRRSIRINTIKAKITDIKKSLTKKGWILTQIPWCKEGFWIEHIKGRRDIGNTEEHVLGYIYVQDAASMIPPIVLDPKSGEIILDMCASPGSKSSQIAAMMKNKGILVSNDYKGMRIRPLGINMQRIGVTNNIISLMDGSRIKDIEFDKILVDAPCSGTGTIRKSLKTLRIWNKNMIKRLSMKQKNLIDTGFQLLRPGGVLVYSTCTLEPQEDEEVVSFLLDKYDDAKTEKIDIKIKKSSIVKEFEDKKYNNGVKNCLRIWPQDNDTEGFFICRIKKQI